MKVIRLLEKNSIQYQYFCPYCHYWILKGNIGMIFCPNCGKQLNWKNSIIDRHHKEWVKISEEKYNELKGN